MTALTTTRIRCKNCRARLRTLDSVWPFRLFILIMGIILGYTLAKLYFSGQISGIAYFILALDGIIIIWAIIDFSFSLLVCNKRGLGMVNKSKDRLGMLIKK